MPAPMQDTSGEIVVRNVRMCMWSAGPPLIEGSPAILGRAAPERHVRSVRKPPTGQPPVGSVRHDRSSRMRSGTARACGLRYDENLTNPRPMRMPGSRQRSAFLAAASALLSWGTPVASAQIPVGEYVARRDSLAGRIGDGIVVAFGG